jgi:hypothetical protein
MTFEKAKQEIVKRGGKGIRERDFLVEKKIIRVTVDRNEVKECI